MIKKICFITPDFDKGGAQKNMLNIINSLDENLFKIDLIILTKNPNTYLKSVNKNINVISFNKSSNISSVLNLFKYLNNNSPKLVFSSLENTSLIITLLKMFFGFNFVNIVRIPSLPSNNLYQTYGKLNLKFYKSIILKMLFKILDKSDHIICQTLDMKNELVNDLGFKNNNIHVITNIVDKNISVLAQESCQAIDTNNFNVISIGTLYRVKGFDYLIKGFSDFNKNNPYNKAMLHILGEEQNEKGYCQYLLNLVSELNLEKKVIFHGHVSNPYKYLVKSNLFILSSIKEGFPNVVLEALTLKVPVVATNCVNFDGIINSDNGLVINKSNASAISQAIQKFYETDIKSVNLKFENFDFNQWFKNI